MALQHSFSSLAEIIPPLTTKEAAAYLKMSVRTLRRYVKQRDIVCSKFNGSLRFEFAELQDFMARRRVDTRTGRGKLHEHSDYASSRRKSTGATVNLSDHIITALREPMTLPAIIDAINAQADVECSPEFLEKQLEILELRGRIVKNGNQYSVPETPAA
jgi:excisionase family DNA binding protein